MSGFFTDSEVCDSEWDETCRPSQCSIKDDYTFTWRAPWKKFQIRVIKSNGLTQQCCSSLLNPLKMQFLTEKDLHLEKLYHVLKKQKYNVIHICSSTELLEIKLISSNVSNIVSEIEAALANEFDDIILKTIPVFPHTPKLAEKLFWTNLKGSNLTLMSDDAKIFIVGFAKMRAIIQDTIYEIDRCSITETVRLIEDWKPKAIKKFSLMEAFSTKFKDVKCTFDEENSCVHLSGLDVTLAEVVDELKKAFSSLFVTKVAFDPLVLKLLKCAESAELFSKLLDKANILPVWTVDERDLLVFSQVKTDNTHILKSIVYDNFLAVGFTFKRGHRNAFCKSKYFLGLIKINKNKLLVVETTSEGVNIATTKTIVHQILNLENTYNIWNSNAVKSNDLQGQWSLHLDGKRIYDREYILQLQFAQKSTEKPKDLPNLPGVILDNPIFRYSLGISVGCVFPYPTQTAQIDRNGTCSSRESVDPTPNVPLQPENNAVKIVVDSRPELLVSGSRNNTSIEVIDGVNKCSSRLQIVEYPSDLPLPTVSSRIKSTVLSTQEIDSKVVKEVTHPIRNTNDSTLQLFLNRVPEKQPQPDTQNTFIQQGKNMYSQQFYPQQKSMRESQQIGQQQGIIYPTMMYMPPSHQGKTINSYEAPIIIQPNPGQIQQTMMIPKLRMPPPSTTYNISTIQTVGGYPMPQTTYPSTIIYPVQTPQRPPSAQGMGQPPQMPQKLEKKVLQIVDPNTGKDILSDMNRSTPPGSYESGSSGHTPNETMDSSTPPQNETSAIAAQFAAHVDAILKSPSGVHPVHMVNTEVPPSMVSTQVQPPVVSNREVHSHVPKEVPLHIVNTQHVSSVQQLVDNNQSLSSDSNVVHSKNNGQLQIDTRTIPEAPETHRSSGCHIPLVNNNGQSKSSSREPSQKHEGSKVGSKVNEGPVEITAMKSEPVRIKSKVFVVDENEQKPVIKGKENWTKHEEFKEDSSHADPHPEAIATGNPVKDTPVAKKSKKVKIKKKMDASDTDSEVCNLPKRNSQTDIKKISDQHVIDLSSMQHEVKLHKAESAWKPSHKKTSEAKSAEDLKTEKLYKKARSILNKLTPQKFQTLVKQMSDMEISSEEDLKGVAYLVFEKAVAEPRFSLAYASMCRYLTQIKVPSTSKPGEVVNFRAILLTRCQKEFEKDKDAGDEIEKLRVTMKEETQEEIIAVMKEEIELAEANIRQRYLGNISKCPDAFNKYLDAVMIESVTENGQKVPEKSFKRHGILRQNRFIGELFKLKMLTEPIMHQCVYKLFNNKDEESLECLGQLLKTIGKELDTDRAKPRIDQYFRTMSKLVEERKTSSRVRFMMQDVIDLRSRNWVPKRDENNPKTIKQIHKEAQQEEQEKMLMLQTVSVQLQSGRESELEDNEVKIIITKTIAILDEYILMLDIKNVITFVNKLRKSSSAIHLFVVVCINQMLERSNQERRHTALFLHDLVKKSIITDKQYLEGFKFALQYAEDKELDIPKIWQYFADLIEPMVQDGSVPVSFLIEACTALKKGSKAGLLLAEIFRVASGSKKLDFTETDRSQPSTPTAKLDDRTTQDKISQ